MKIVNRLLLAAFTLSLAGIVNAGNLSTLGSPGYGTLYACAVVSADHYDSKLNKVKGHDTYCHALVNQSTNIANKDASKYVPASISNFDSEDTFFWYRRNNLTQGSPALASYCSDHIDHFKDCEWATYPEATQLAESHEKIDVPDNIKEFLAKQTSPSLTSGGVYGCAVVLCLANPNGWGSVSECKPPIKKLFKDLAKGKSFPSCNNN